MSSIDPNAVPIITTQGCPGSILAQLKISESLTNPTAHGLIENRINKAERRTWFLSEIVSNL